MTEQERAASSAWMVEVIIDLLEYSKQQQLTEVTKILSESSEKIAQLFLNQENCSREPNFTRNLSPETELGESGDVLNLADFRHSASH